MTTDSAQRQIENLAFMLDYPADLRDRIREAFQEVSKTVWLAEGGRVLMEGDRNSDAGFVLLRGAVIVTNADGFAKTILPPALLGEMKQFGITGVAERMASVTVDNPATLLAFEWDALYDALAAKLNADELQLFRDTLRKYAWMHFLEMEDEL